MTPFDHGRAGVTQPSHRELTVLLRAAQWKLDDVAHDIPAGRYTTAQCQHLGELLIELGRLLCSHTGLVESPPSAIQVKVANPPDFDHVEREGTSPGEDDPRPGVDKGLRLR